MIIGSVLLLDLASLCSFYSVLPTTLVCIKSLLILWGWEIKMLFIPSLLELCAKTYLNSWFFFFFPLNNYMESLAVFSHSINVSEDVFYFIKKIGLKAGLESGYSYYLCCHLSVFVISLVPSLLLTTICKELTVVSPSTIYKMLTQRLLPRWMKILSILIGKRNIFQKYNIGEEG